MSIAIYPGSFDPITLGHLDIIKRASKLFDKVIVVSMKNPQKSYLFNDKERLDMMKKTCEGLSNVECVIGEGLTVEFAKKHNANIMIRGMRAVADYEFEMKIAMANMHINESIETVFLLSKPEYSFVSSSVIKELVTYGQNVEDFVIKYVEDELKKKLL